MTRRYLTTAILAAAVTFGLFYLMQFLVSMEGSLVEDEFKGRTIEFVRLKRDSDLELKKRQLPDKEKPDEAPPPPDLDLSNVPQPTEGNLDIATPEIGFDLALAGGPQLGEAPSDSDIMPLVRVLPVYPPRAQSRGIEGWVLVEFTISPAGTVKDPVVIDAEPSGIFNRAMLRAIRKWKYQPKIVDGVAVARPGVRVRQNFELEQ